MDGSTYIPLETQLVLLRSTHHLVCRFGVIIFRDTAEDLLLYLFLNDVLFDAILEDLFTLNKVEIMQDTVHNNQNAGNNQPFTFIKSKYNT